MSQLKINLEIIGANKVNQTLKSVEQRLKNLQNLNKNLVSSNKNIYDKELNSAKKLYEFKKKEEMKLASWKEKEIYRQGQREARAARTAVKKPSGRLASGVASGVMRGGGAILGAMGVGAGISGMISSAMDAAEKKAEVKRSLIPFITQLEGFTGGAADKAKQESLATNVQRTSAKTGFSSDQIVQSLLAAQGIGGQGDLYAKNLDKFASIAQAYGANLEDVMKTAATAFYNLPEDMKKNQEDAMKNVFGQISTVIGGGQAGTLSPEMISSIFGKIAANAKGIGGDYSTNVKTQLGMAQMIAPSVGSPEEVATSLRALTSDLVSKSKEMKSKFGINTISNGKVRDPLEVMKEFLVKTKGNVKAQVMFGESSRKAVQALAGLYSDGGIPRIMSEFEKVTVSAEGMDAALKFASEGSDKMAQERAKIQEEMAKAGDELRIAFIDASPAIIEFAKAAAVATKEIRGYLADIGGKYGDTASYIINRGDPESQRKRVENKIKEANEQSKKDAKSRVYTQVLNPEYKQNNYTAGIDEANKAKAEADAEASRKAQEAYEKQLDAAEKISQAANNLSNKTAPIGTGKTYGF